MKSKVYPLLSFLSELLFSSFSSFCCEKEDSFEKEYSYEKEYSFETKEEKEDLDLLVERNRKNKEKMVKSLHPVYDGLRSLHDIEVNIKKSTYRFKISTSFV